MKNKTFLFVLRVLLGLTFIVSAITKMISIEPFELFILHYKFISWDFATLIARLLISFEFILGVLIISKLYFRQMIIISFSTLLFFSTFLVLLLFSKTAVDNCNCFGDYWKMTPLESLIKNVILIIISVILRTEKSYRLRYQFFFISVFAAIAIATPIIMKPPTFLYQSLYMKEAEVRPFAKEYLGTPEFSGEIVNVDRGKYVVALFSTSCYHCFETAKKLSLIYNRAETKFPLYYILGGDIAHIDTFWEKSESIHFPYKFVYGRDFLDLTKGAVPKIYLIENGMIMKTFFNDQITEDNILPFFEE